jgi:hypothetical protein
MIWPIKRTTYNAQCQLIKEDWLALLTRQKTREEVYIARFSLTSVVGVQLYLGMAHSGDEPCVQKREEIGNHATSEPFSDPLWRHCAG